MKVFVVTSTYADGEYRGVYATFLSALMSCHETAFARPRPDQSGPDRIQWDVRTADDPFIFAHIIETEVKP
jgi:hypothetical protein